MPLAQAAVAGSVRPAEAPAVSVVVACYNAEATLEAAVASALAQTLEATEVLLVDDASTDSTPSVIERLCRHDRRVRALHLPVNAGAAAARNLALDVAEGEWIAVLDADDSFAPERLERLVAVAEADHADLVSDNQWLRNAHTGRDLGLLWHPDELSAIKWLEIRRFIQGNMLSTKVTGFGYMKPLIKRSFLQEHGLRYDATLRIAEDYDCALACLIAGARWRVLPEAYYVYSIGRPSLSMRLQPEFIEPLMRSSRARLQHAILAPEVRRLLELHHDDLVRSLAHAEFVHDVRRGAIARACKRLLDHPDITFMAGRSVIEGLAKRVGLRQRDGKWIEPAYKAR